MAAQKSTRLTEVEKLFISAIEAAVGIKLGFEALKDSFEEKKQLIRTFLAEYGVKKDEGVFWKKVVRRVLKGRQQVDVYEASLTPQYTYDVDRDKLIALLGLEKAVECMTVVSRTQIHKMIDSKVLFKKNGELLTKDELDAIATKRVKAQELDFEVTHSVPSLDEEAGLNE